jgi:cell division septation protein DedD
MKVIGSIAVLLIAYSLQLTAANADTDSMTTLEKFYLQGRYDQAITEADRLIDARVNRRYEVYYVKALSELKAGRFSNARETFGKLIDAYPDSPRVFDANIGIGDSYYLAGNRIAAESIYKDALKKFPGDKNAALARERLDNCKSTQTAKAVQSVQSAPPPMADRRQDPAAQHFLPAQVPRGEVTEGLSVQVGSFKSKRNAENLSNKLRKQGYESYVEIPVTSKDKLYRVKVGHLSSKEEAEKLAARLKVRGYPTRICAGDACR